MIYMFLANGFEEVEALFPLDLLRRAGLKVTTVGIGGDRVVGSHGIAVEADIPDTMYRDSKPEMVILPGGMPGTLHLDQSPTVERALRAAEANGAYLAAICAAPMVLGKRGYLQGKRATCFPGFEEHLLGATATAEGVVTDGHVITAKGMGVAMDFGLTLVALLCGQEKADELRAAIQAG
ncbi:MAG: DJ-1/PfpI family protein [Ruminococcaceae bacterium]|nr:DJ-1/PfpI family protein [Oscillospiraceae bacterium]